MTHNTNETKEYGDYLEATLKLNDLTEKERRELEQALTDFIRTAGVRRGINACRDILRAEYLLQVEANNDQQYTVRRLLEQLDSLTVEQAEEV